MTYRDIDVNVSRETKAMLLEVQKFGMEGLSDRNRVGIIDSLPHLTPDIYRAT